MARRSRRWFWPLLAALLLAGWYQAQRLQDGLQRLQAEGFQVDLRIEHNPLLVFDRGRRQGALVYPDRAERFPVDDLIKLEWQVQSGSDRETQPELWLYLRQRPGQPLRLRGSEAQLRGWQAALEALRTTPSIAADTAVSAGD